MTEFLVWCKCGHPKVGHSRATGECCGCSCKAFSGSASGADTPEQDWSRPFWVLDQAMMDAQHCGRSLEYVRQLAEIRDSFANRVASDLLDEPPVAAPPVGPNSQSATSSSQVGSSPDDDAGDLRRVARIVRDGMLGEGTTLTADQCFDVDDAINQLFALRVALETARRDAERWRAVRQTTSSRQHWTVERVLPHRRSLARFDQPHRV